MLNESTAAVEMKPSAPAKRTLRKAALCWPWVAAALAWPASAGAWVQAPVGAATFRAELLPGSQAVLRVSGYQTLGGNAGECGVVALKQVGPIIMVNQVQAMLPGNQAFVASSVVLNFNPSTAATFFFQTNQGGAWQGFASVFNQPIPPALPVEWVFTVALQPNATLAQLKSALAAEGRGGTDQCHAGGIPTGARLAVVPLTPPLPNSYVVTVPAGLSTLANNLHLGGNLLDQVLPAVVDATTLFKFDPVAQHYLTFTFFTGLGWLDDTGSSASTTLAPGEGAWISSEVDQLILFGGEPLPPQPPPRPPPGFYLVGCRTPQPSGFEELMGFPPMIGDRVFKYDSPLPQTPAPGTEASSIHTFGPAGWDIPPVLEVGKGAFVRLAQATQPPVILLQPQDQTAVEGSTVSFLVQAVSEGEQPTYQWHHNGLALPDQTNATLTLTNVQSADAGPYYVRVTTSGGDVWSETAWLTVTRTNTQPVLDTIHNQVVHAGTMVSFQVTATDPDAETGQLTFSLDPGAPSGAWIDPLTGQCTWATTAEDAEEVYPITVRVTDNGLPPLSDTKTFTVVVVSAPLLEAINHHGTNVTLTWAAIPCQIYQVLYAPDVTGPWQPLGEAVQATNTTATKRDDTVTEVPYRYYAITTVPVIRIPVCWPSFCFLIYKIQPGPGITADAIAPPAGETTNKVNEPIPLIVTGEDTDQLIQTCICISPEDICTSSRSLDLADSMIYTWTIVAGEGSLVSTDGPATLYRPPNLATGETRTVTIKAEIKDTRGNDKVATVTYTIELSRPSECEYKRQVDIARATDPGTRITLTSSPCDCQPQPPAWIVAPRLTGDAAATLKLCVGERHLLNATGVDNDRLRLVCLGTYCGLAIRRPVLLDETRYHWTSTLGGFPDYGGAADSNSRKTTVVYKAPDTPGEDEVTITIQDSGRQAPDAPLEKKIKIKLCKVDLQYEGLSEDDEECPGGFLCYNRDDDNKNETLDKDEAGQVDNEDDLKKITLTKEPKEGNVTLRAAKGGDKIKVWEKSTKATEVTLPKTYPAADLPKELWVEGVKLSTELNDVELELVSDDPPCRDLVKLTVVTVDLDGDADHDGTVEENGEDEKPENDLPGILTLCNLDDDDENGVKDNEGADAATINDGPANNDSDDFAPLVLRQIPVLPKGASVELTLHTPQNLEAGRGLGAGDVVRIFADYNGANAAVILGPGTTTFVLPKTAAHKVDLDSIVAGDISNLGFEGLEFAGEVKLKAELKVDGKVVCWDEVQLKVSPLLLVGHHRNPVDSYVARAVGADSVIYCTVAFPGATPLAVANDHVIPILLSGGDQWAQDELQIGFQQAPYKSWHVLLDSKRNGGLDTFAKATRAAGGVFGPDFGHIEITDGTPRNSLDSFGNLEVTPPLKIGAKDYPFGRIYYGDNPAGRRMDRRLRDFWQRQRITGEDPIQDPVTFNSDWLDVGHVDEFMSIVPDAVGTHGWKVILADPRLAVNILAGGGGHPGVDPNLHIPRYDDFNLGGAAIDTVAALLARGLDTPVMGGSATIDAYNLNEATDILFGPPGAAHRGGIKRQIRDAFGLAWTDFIEVPVLFNLDGDAVAITPGLANGAVYPGIYIAPEVFLRHNTLAAAGEEDANRNFRLDVGEDANANGRLDTLRDPFHVHLDAHLPAGIASRYIDDWEVYHLLGGEVHCSSNERREIPIQKWWE